MQIGVIEAHFTKLDGRTEFYVITQLRIPTSLSVITKCFYDTPSYTI